jgi:hypothetical protein
VNRIQRHGSTILLSISQQFNKPTIRIQHPRYVKVLLSHIKCGVQIFKWIVLAELVIIYQVWAMAMDEGTESQTILEAAKKKNVKFK